LELDWGKNDESDNICYYTRTHTRMRTRATRTRARTHAHAHTRTHTKKQMMDSIQCGGKNKPLKIFLVPNWNVTG